MTMMTIINFKNELSVMWKFCWPRGLPL